jgi:glycosyltransferase involved in cell wall biosynthesis
MKSETGPNSNQTSEKLPLVSIVMAAYNGERFLEEQLKSLFSQTYRQIEIIVVDDGSMDNTVKLLQENAAQHPNMKVFLNHKNIGFIKTFDKACSLASGELLAPCDQDDCWESSKIEKLVNNIGNAAMIYSDSYVCDENLKIKDKKISDKVNCIDFNSCLQQCIYSRIYGHATLFTKTLYQKSTPFILDIPHDWWLCYNATLTGGIKYFNEPLVYYRQHAANAIGVVGEKRKRQPEQKKDEGVKERTRNRVRAFYERCPTQLVEEKKVLKELVDCYRSFSLTNNIKRTGLFLMHVHDFLAPKKKSLIMKYLFCLKMFVKIK